MQPSIPRLLVATAALACGLAAANAQLPAGSALSIARGTASNSASVTVTDPGNHTWVLQSSPDLATWTDVETWKVGRALFYDKRLSENQTVACASCHQQAHGFSDPRKFSVGFLGGETGRNSMGLANARWYLRRAFFWDERAATLEDQVLQPIQNAVEMGMTLPALVTRLSAEPYYVSLFTNAFGSATVTSDRIAHALAQFVRSIVSTQTKFDAGVASGFTNFTAQENQGRQIFNGLGNCTACHGTDNFVPGAAINNNGLENPYLDKGVGDLTGRPQDEGLFKVPSLRNIELTAPYMHDGRFATLAECIDHYNTGFRYTANLDANLETAVKGRLTAQDKADLIAFLQTLTDDGFVANPAFTKP